MPEGAHWPLQWLIDVGHQREREKWNHTAALLAMQAELHRDHKKRRRPYEPSDFHPFDDRRKITDGMPMTVDNLHALKPLFKSGKLK